MSQPAITLEVLPAGFGDCLLVSCPVGRSTWRMLVDTGPDETYPALRRRLLQIPRGADGKRHIDLFVVSHIDHDHIGGARLLLGDDDLGLSFSDVWFNAPPKPCIRGVAEGQSLADILGAGHKALPWNTAWSGQPESTPAEGAGWSSRAPGCRRSRCCRRRPTDSPTSTGCGRRNWSAGAARSAIARSPLPPRHGEQCPASRHWPPA